MAKQRLTQGNADSALRLTKADLLIAGETPRYDGKVLRIVRMRIARDGFAERAVYDIGFAPSSFWHYWNYLPPDRVEEITSALQSAHRALTGVEIEEDSNGHYRLIDIWAGGRRAQLKMQYVQGRACHHVPEFEAAWAMVLGQFPSVPDPV